MPTKSGKDSKGCFWQWGSKAKYYYTCGDKDASARAKAKADKQGTAAYATGYTEMNKISMLEINNFIESLAELLPGEDEVLEKVGSTKSKDKPGGSGAGTYTKGEGPFCGPSGGAPAGTYPVGTKKRARAALAYARHAPNPGGIKACVCRHWSDLPICKKGD